MKIVFLSNYINHHQIGLSDELNKLCGKNNYWFIQEEELSSERQALGYKNDFCNREYLVMCTKENYDYVKQLINEADIIINCFSQGLNYLDEAMNNKKIILWYQERLFKDYNFLMTFAKFIRAKKYINYKKNPNQYHLFASYYGYDDTAKVFKESRDKSFLFGYFPTTNSSVEKEKNINTNQLQILYIGRLIDWKHPEFMFKIAKILDEKKIDFKISIIGSGYMLDKIKKTAEKSFKDKVFVLGSIPFGQIVEEYDKNDIFIFPSDRREGWGATLGEAMSHGLIAFANEEAGSSKVLINDGKNGFLYNKKNYKEKFIDLLDSIKKDGTSISKEASSTIVNKWNYKIAADRLFNVCTLIKKDEDTNIYNEGVMKKIQKGDKE